MDMHGDSQICGRMAVEYGKLVAEWQRKELDLSVSYIMEL